MTNEQREVLELVCDYPEEYGRMLGYTKLRKNPHRQWLQMMLQGVEDQTLQGHRGSYKTTCLGEAIGAKMWLQPERTIIFQRKTDDDVKEIIAQVKRNLEHPVTQELHRMLFGRDLTLKKSTATELTTNVYSAPRGASQLLGIGIGGSITGKHADDIYTDDIVNLQDRLSRAERERTKSNYQELNNVRNPGGRIFNTGTPWHPEDAFSIMPKALRFDCYSTGLLSQQEIDARRQRMAPSLFAANYELRHIAAEGAMFAEPPKFTDDESVLRDGIAHIDAAYGGEDYTAFTCGARSGDTIYLYGRLWRSHVDNQMEAMGCEMERLMCAPVYMETNGDKGYLAREARARGWSVRPYSETMNKHMKISTLLRKWWGNVVFVRGTDPEYIRQIADYTDSAAHDDAPDSAACICRILDRRR